MTGLKLKLPIFKNYHIVAHNLELSRPSYTIVKVMVKVGNVST